MSDDLEFLAKYDPGAFTPVAAAVDLVILAIIDRKLSVFVPFRDRQPERDRNALPGSMLQPDEDLEGCAARTLREKVGDIRVSVRQFATFSAPERDKRMRVISISYLALTTPKVMQDVPVNKAGVREIGTIGVGDEVVVYNDIPEPISLAFDHDEIVTAAVRRLQADLDRSDDAFQLLPDEFTLFDLQIVHEAIRGKSVNKPAFRKRMLDSGRLKPLGRRATSNKGRPAELYALRESAE